MSEGERTCRRAEITGKVQGVWYRGWTVETARSFGLDGWVRNRADGSVEALFAGSAAAVTAMLEACRGGPPAANVASVNDFPAEGPAPGSGFQQLPTL